MDAERNSFQTVIIGAGFSGIGLAIELLKRGHEDFVILEKAEKPGGTWRENTYPGCACDVPSHLYSYSFDPKSDWNHFFAKQPEIQEYLESVVLRYDLSRKIRLNCEVLAARWSGAHHRWDIDTSSGEMTSKFLVGGQGPLHEPRRPDVPGLNSFSGDSFHTAQWDHSVSLSNKRVAVIGTGSSSIQFVPEIQPEVDSLTVYQRTAPWVLPKPDRRTTNIEKRLFEVSPVQSAFRQGIYAATECLQLAQRSPAVMRQVQRLGKWQLRRQVADPALREELTPDFALGCKRLLLSNAWYPAIQASNAELVPRGVRSITPNGVIDETGVEREADVLIFATGFHVSDAAVPANIYGRTGQSLAERWAGTPCAYLGTTVAGFPNLFLMLGPNLGNGHGSAFIIIEAQAKYITDAIEFAEDKRLASLEPDPFEQELWNTGVQSALQTTVWNAGGCKSWYIDANGVNSSIYPWTTIDLRRRLRTFNPKPFQLTREVDMSQPTQFSLATATVAITGGARGIGLATARAFIEQGANVCIGDLDHRAAKEAALSLGPNAHAFSLDVSSRDSFRTFLGEVEATVGPVDVLVNNAGIMPTGGFLSEPEETLDAVHRVNVLGPSVGMKIVLPKMIARRRGHVVNVASVAGKFAIPYLGSYCASKHAVVALSASVQPELEGTGVSLTTVMPWIVKTRLSADVPTEGLFVQTPEDVAAVIVKSCSTRDPEMTVPELLRPLLPLYNMIPRRTFGKLTRLLNAARLADPTVRRERAEYEDACVSQGRETGS